ncbi:MAG: ABC transporter substrate-binding protein [Alphaproteobacteria bacterium]|nr:transporter substrate-binding domain-containing protein [Alphaproteobacteria bacterium]TAD91441.1 MAG: ABC transporter substrate-binding protein [Alphaproteobacteria bacterium]
MKKLLATALAAAALLLAPGADAQQRTIRIASEGAFPPWNATDASGKLIGFEVDLANQLCQRMQVRCEIVAQAWDGIIPALQARRYDAIMAGMSITARRLEVINFSIPYGSSPARLAVQRQHRLASWQTPGNVERIRMDALTPPMNTALEELRKAISGMTVGVQTQTIHSNFLDEHLKNVVRVRTYDTMENMVLDLNAGRVDAVFGSGANLKALSDKGDNIAMFGPGFSGGTFGAGVGVGLRKDDADLKAMFDQAITWANETGVIRRLSMQWFGFDISIN